MHWSLSVAGGYLHRIIWRDSATCPQCNETKEMAEHLVLHCLAHDHAWQESWPNLHYQSDPRHLWNFQERIGVMTRPTDRPGMTEKAYCSHYCNTVSNNDFQYLIMVRLLRHSDRPPRQLSRRNFAWSSGVIRLSLSATPSRHSMVDWMFSSTMSSWHRHRTQPSQ